MIKNNNNITYNKLSISEYDEFEQQIYLYFYVFAEYTSIDKKEFESAN